MTQTPAQHAAAQLNYLIGQVLRREPRADPHVVRALILDRLAVEEAPDAREEQSAAAIPRDL